MSSSTLNALQKVKASGLYELPIFKVNGQWQVFFHDVHLSPSMPALGAGNKSIAFGDLSRFIRRQVRNSITVRTYNELFATSGQIAYEAAWRVDGKWPERRIRRYRFAFWPATRERISRRGSSALHGTGGGERRLPVFPNGASRTSLHPSPKSFSVRSPLSRRAENGARGSSPNPDPIRLFPRAERFSGVRRSRCGALCDWARDGRGATFHYVCGAVKSPRNGDQKGMSDSDLAARSTKSTIWEAAMAKEYSASSIVTGPPSDLTGLN